MSLQGKKPDDYARAFTSHPEPDLLKIHDPDKFACTPCHQGNGRATTSVEKAHGTYEHWLWPLFAKGNMEAGCQTCHAADMVLVSNDVGWTLSDGKDLFRQRGCVGCHRYEGYDKEPEDLLSVAQQIKQLEQEKKDNFKQAHDLMKQSAKAKRGKAAHGKELFGPRGCLACHSIGEVDELQGGTFAANLTRVGEKDNYDYLVRWVHNARERTRPYCPYEKKDIGPEDYKKKGLPYVFDLDHSKCPNDGHELQVQNMTVMPSLRLAPQDAEDVATYLISLKKQRPSSYADASVMDRPNLKAEGKEEYRR